MSYNTYSITTTGTDASLTKPRTESAVLIAISGTYGGLTFTIEGTADGTNWSSIYAIDGVTGLLVAGGTSISPTDNLEKTWIVPSAANFTGVRMNVSAISSGTAVFKGFGSNVIQQSYNVQSASTGAFTNLTASGTLAVTGASTLTGAVGIGAATTVTSTSASALAVGANGATNPVLSVNANTASVATGLTIIGAAAAGGVALTVISSGTNENLAINAKGSGTLSLNATATGTVSVGADLTMADAKNIVVNATTGTKIGTATTQKLSFYNKTPIVQPAANTDTTTGAAGSTTNVFLNTTFTGAGGTAAYTVGGVVTALKALGLLAA